MSHWIITDSLISLNKNNSIFTETLKSCFAIDHFWLMMIFFALIQIVHTRWTQKLILALFCPPSLLSSQIVWLQYFGHEFVRLQILRSIARQFDTMRPQKLWLVVVGFGHRFPGKLYPNFIGIIILASSTPSSHHHHNYMFHNPLLSVHFLEPDRSLHFKSCLIQVSLRSFCFHFTCYPLTTLAGKCLASQTSQHLGRADVDRLSSTWHTQTQRPNR